MVILTGLLHYQSQFAEIHKRPKEEDMKRLEISFGSAGDRQLDPTPPSCPLFHTYLLT
jgi:hypothetical protein